MARQPYPVTATFSKIRTRTHGLDEVRVYDRGAEKVNRWRIDVFQNGWWAVAYKQNGEACMYENLESAQRQAQRISNRLQPDE
jgi:hypothetical protein